MSKEVRDMLGNELKEGDLVAVNVCSPFIFIVRKISPGGLQDALGRETPIVITVEAELTMSASPGIPVPNVVKVAKPREAKPN
jgi:hypothetical protein